MVVSLEEELHESRYCGLSSINLPQGLPKLFVARVQTREKGLFGFTKTFYYLVTKLLVLQECSFITCLFRFSEIVVSHFDGINKNFGHPWESFSVRKHSIKSYTPVRQTLINVIWYKQIFQL